MSRLSGADRTYRDRSKPSRLARPDIGLSPRAWQRAAATIRTASSSPVSGSLGASRVIRDVHQAQMMLECAEYAMLGFRGQAIKKVGSRRIRLGQRQRAIAGSADVISRNHCASPTRVLFNAPSALPALTFDTSHAAGSGSVRSVTPLSQRADATRVERDCVIALTLQPLSTVAGTVAFSQSFLERLAISIGLTGHPFGHGSTRCAPRAAVSPEATQTLGPSVIILALALARLFPRGETSQKRKYIRIGHRTAAGVFPHDQTAMPASTLLEERHEARGDSGPVDLDRRSEAPSNKNGKHRNQLYHLEPKNRFSRKLRSEATEFRSPSRTIHHAASAFGEGRRLGEHS
jgi:hypothetical protein